MPLKDLSIRNFRNFSELELSFDSGLHVIEGENAQGKTNLLEAIYVLANGRSFRSQDLETLIRWENPKAFLSTVILHDGLESQIQSRWSGAEKTLSLQGKTIHRYGKIHEILRVLVFTPESTALFRTLPSHRRKYFDLAIGIHQPGYSSLLSRYQKVLRQRNSLLESQAPRSLRDPFDQQWAELALQILHERERYLQALHPFWRQRLQDLTETIPEMAARWHGSLASRTWRDPEALLAELRRRESEELRAGRSLLGPQRDDLLLELEGKSAKEIASQGQHRLLVLALKLAESDLFIQRTGLSPVFLLDDIGSELDTNHWRNLLESLAGIHSQTFLSSAHPGAFDSLKAQRFRVSQGKIS